MTESVCVYCLKKFDSDNNAKYCSEECSKEGKSKLDKKLVEKKTFWQYIVDIVGEGPWG